VRPAVLTLLSVSLLLLLAGADLAVADNFVGGTDSWTVVGSPNEQRILQNGMLLTYHNNLAFSTQGIIVMVLRNSAGQMVYYGTSTTSLDSSSSGVVFVVEFGLPSGTYNATIFPFTFGGVALSVPTYSTFTV
jgi:hypothetical protein